ncbi:pentatricopeptide repeat-containing protein At5g15010, mitochondrial-like [Rutidosis leptorrhynchoides]|uniref:pentatricopeptide repeat-containing protein At5g15010, mitochondrial-like n=1 Tax=Rutidosis leptorrhynchoides TaxID=125765 RepID=UPI003A9A2122
MSEYRKRHRHDSPSRNQDRRTRKSPHHSPSPNPEQPTGKRPIFTSYIDTPNLSVKVKLLCESIVNTPSLELERVLNDSGLRVSTEDVEDVLKLSYGHPVSAIKFFRWAGYQLNDRHSPYSWNLVVDMLGKHRSFDAMWDAVKSMKQEGILSLATFASIFGSYVIADRVKEAIRAFEVMDQYGCLADIVALNSLFSAICRDGKTVDASEFLDSVKSKIKPDADTYAILLEGWEKERDVVNAKRTFRDMVDEIGWEPSNFPAYDSFLNTLLKGSGGIREALKYFESLKERSCYPGTVFFKAALNEAATKGDLKSGILLWDGLTVQNGFKIDTELYNSMILLYVNVEEAELAKKTLDEMVLNGVFPDSDSYNILLQYLLTVRMLKEAQVMFSEMNRNEFVPTHGNCCMGIRVFLDGGDPYTAIKIWKCMVENYESDFEETGNVLVSRLRDLNRFPEAVKYANDMIDRKIKLSSATLAMLRHSLAKAGKGSVYDEMFNKWKLI